MSIFRRFMAVLPFIVVLFNCGNLSASEMPLYELKIRIFPESHTINGTSKITIPGALKTTLRTKGLNIRSFRIDHQEYEPPEISRDDMDRDLNDTDALQSAESDLGEGIYHIETEASGVVEINYTAIIEPSHKKEENEDNETTVKNVVTPSEILLLSNYYPVIEGLANYQLTIELPSDFEAISEADAITVMTVKDRKICQFAFPHPLPGIALAAGKYWAKEEEYKGIKIKTFLFSEDERLAARYIERTKNQIELYEPLVGKYPYKTFSIVESNFQTGYSRPTYSLVGSTAIGLPVTSTTPLGHAYLHQWFGNYVYVDDTGGNWSEGLTTYLADHWCAHMEGKGAQYRKKILIDYRNYVLPEKEIALKDFIGRKNFSSETIGYGKAAMIFHMLRISLGDEIFFKAIREFISSNRFKRVAWKNVADSFIQASQKNLKHFFDQWIQRKGAPHFDVKNARALFRNGRYLLEIEITQEGDPFSLELPARVKTTSGDDTFRIKINDKRTLFERPFSEKPLEILLDENYDVFRTLSKKEVPPVISAFMGNKESIAISPNGDAGKYGDVTDFFKTRGYRVTGEEEVTDEDIKNHSILIMSPKNKIYRRLFADRPVPDGGLVVKAQKNPMNSDRVVLILKAKDEGELKGALEKISSHGNYSFLVFEKGETVSKEIAESERGITIDLKMTVEGIETNESIGLDQIIQKIKNKRIIYVGELHDQYSHHLVQLEIIKQLHHENKEVMIGMEMFQRPFQKVIDSYIRGEMTEKEFIIKTEYFDRWRFNYNLYRDIIQFARAKSLPIVALNLRKEITEKVSKNGIDSLTEEEYREIPQDMDLTNQKYRDYLKEIFTQHPSVHKKDFENFFQSQILWDETMAHSIAGALRKYPQKQMVVMAGNGHLHHAWGIPGRVKRIVDASSSIILNDEGDRFTRGIADFVVFPAKIEPPKSPKLMVYLKKGEEGVVVEKIIKGGTAYKAGIHKGDIIKAIDGNAVEDIDDIKIILLTKKLGDRIKVKVHRERLFFGMKEIAFDVVL